MPMLATESHSRRLALPLVIAASVILSVAGCGSSGDPSASKPTVTKGADPLYCEKDAYDAASFLGSGDPPKQWDVRDVLGDTIGSAKREAAEHGCAVRVRRGGSRDGGRVVGGSGDTAEVIVKDGYVTEIWTVYRRANR